MKDAVLPKGRICSRGEVDYACRGEYNYNLKTMCRLLRPVQRTAFSGVAARVHTGMKEISE